MSIPFPFQMSAFLHPRPQPLPSSRLERASNSLVQLGRKVPHVVGVQPRHRNAPVRGQVDVRLLDQRLALCRPDPCETTKAKHSQVSFQVPPAFRPPVSPSSAAITPALLPLIGSNALPPANQSVLRQPARHLLHLPRRAPPLVKRLMLQLQHFNQSIAARPDTRLCPCRDQARVLRPFIAPTTRAPETRTRAACAP